MLHCGEGSFLQKKLPHKMLCGSPGQSIVLFFKISSQLRALP